MSNGPPADDAPSADPTTDRSRSDGGLLDPGGNRSLLVDALIGAVATVLLSFVGISPVLGGALAGYLHREDGPKVGALSGLVAAVPAFFGILFLLFLAPLGLAVGADFAAGAVVLVGFVFLVLLFVTGWNVVLGAVGGFVGEKLAAEYPDPPW